MPEGIALVVYPVDDLKASKELYTTLFGIAPYADGPSYVGFRVGNVEFGLDANGPSRGMTAPVAYWPVDDIHKTLQDLLSAGARAHTDVIDVGSGQLVALLKDLGGNLIGLAQK